MLRAAEDIPAGTKIQSKHLAEAEAGKYGLPDNIINDKSLIIDRIAKTDIIKVCCYLHCSCLIFIILDKN